MLGLRFDWFENCRLQSYFRYFTETNRSCDQVEYESLNVNQMKRPKEVHFEQNRSSKMDTKERNRRNKQKKWSDASGFASSRAHYVTIQAMARLCLIDSWTEFTKLSESLFKHFEHRIDFHFWNLKLEII